MGKGYSSRCSVCNHPQVDLIHDMLRRRALGESELTNRFIIAKISELGGPDIPECTFSRHVTRHFDIAEEGRRRAMEQYNAASDDVAEKTIGDLEFLDSVKAAVSKMMVDGELKPDIGDALNAIKIKHGTVMKDDNPLAALIDIVAEAAGNR